MSSAPFDYNDLVQVVTTAPARFHPDETGVVVGFTTAETDYLASHFGVEIGETILTIELIDGSSFEAPSKLLVRIG